ncbi:hypothetical protein [Bowdeniella massiliensis]|uniref:hypothetical protein n=1 Tax=Bowdeniella massiliensis TaxID=2932264 RepID=UPI002028265E|nr:hypothetical protein [Bowdeniella massiliensis]
MSGKTADLYVLTKGDLTIPTSLVSEKNRLLNEGFTLDEDKDTKTETEASKSESSDKTSKPETAKTASKK